MTELQQAGETVHDMGISLGDTLDKTILGMLNTQPNITDTSGSYVYELTDDDVKERFDEYLARKKLPCFEKILEVFYEHNPEYML